MDFRERLRTSTTPPLFMAPMEGVVDMVMREALTDIGGIDFCVTEFMRVTHHLHSDKSFFDYCPELRQGCRTRSGVPIYFQLLGGQPEPMAENARRACELGALGIDLNFGCPAKTVNRHDGGAALLQFPERLYNITRAVREAVPPHLSVSAKIRLGFTDKSLYKENSIALAEGGSDWLTVHARTKVDGYRPPAYWEYIAEIREVVSLPVIANGEIWDLADFQRCREMTQSPAFMIGRGALSNPFLFREIQDFLRGEGPATTRVSANGAEEEASAAIFKNALLRIPRFFESCREWRHPHFAMDRSKQWLRSLSVTHVSAKPTFDRLKVITEPTLFETELKNVIQEISFKS
jgi:tRNA-dihydrouridine synthase C